MNRQNDKSQRRGYFARVRFLAAMDLRVQLDVPAEVWNRHRSAKFLRGFDRRSMALWRLGRVDRFA